jgi:ADP-heptose:LPS heptosyltransferase
VSYSTLIAADLKRRYSGVRVDLLTFAEHREFARRLGVFDEILAVDKRSGAAFALDTLRLLATHLTRPRYDACVDLEHFSRYTAMHAAFTGASIRIGWWAPALWRNGIYTHWAHFNTAKHICDVYGLISTLLGAPTEATPVAPRLEEAERRAADAKARAAGWDGVAPLIGVNVNASDLALGRRWPADRFARLIEALVADGCFVCLTGAPSERAYVEQCRQLLSPEARGRAANLAGELSLFEFLALLGLMRLFVSNDSGPMILSALTDTPSVTLWGPGDPAMFGGRSPRHTFCYADYPCSPCLYAPGTSAGLFCNWKFPCMTAIAADAVIAEARRRLREEERSDAPSR